MRSSLYRVISAAMMAAVFGLMANVAFANKVEVNINNGKDIFEKGKGAAAACNSCHGQSGTGDDAMGTPRLVKLGYPYIVKQLTDFAEDKRIDTTLSVMNIFAKELSVADRRDVAAYLESLTVEMPASNMEDIKKLGQPVGQSHLGKRIVFEGITEKGISACSSCHGYNGRGVAPLYPAIGKQRYVYLVTQLKKWRDGSRANDILSQMQKVAKNLSDDDIYNVSAYLTKAPLTSRGNSRIPVNH